MKDPALIASIQLTERGLMPLPGPAEQRRVIHLTNVLRRPVEKVPNPASEGRNGAAAERRLTGIPIGSRIWRASIYWRNSFKLRSFRRSSSSVPISISSRAYFGMSSCGRLTPIRWSFATGSALWVFYIRTVDDTGRSILPEVLQQVVSIASSAVPQYTNGRFGVAGIEQGTDTRKGQAGWITIEWTRNATQFCGSASVGQEGGTVTLTYDQPGCSCGSQKIRPRTVKHELGHSLGLWHTGQSVDLMSGIAVSECDRNITARELQYLDYLYRRPVGNTDPDSDPSSAALLRPVRVMN